MQITVENGGGCKRIIRAEVPAGLVSEKLSEGYREVNRQFTLPGFRKGKAPRSVLEKRFGTEILNEVRQTLADDAIKQAVESNALKILGQPELVSDVNFQPGSGVTLTLEAEVFPEFELPEYKGVEVSRPVLTIHDHEVYARQRSRQMAHGELAPVDGPAAKGHLLRAAVRVTGGDLEIFRQDAGLLEVGVGWIAGLKPVDGEGALVGLKAGDSKVVRAAIPEDYGREELRGKDCVIHVDVMLVLEFKGPDLEQVAQKEGRENLAAWSEDVRAEALAEREAGIDRMVEDRVMRKIMDATTIELPEKFSKRRAAELVQQTAYRMYRDGATEEQVRDFLENSKDKGVDDVRDSLKRAFIIDAIARRERVIVTEDELDREVARLAAALGREAVEFKTELRARGTLDGMRDEMRTQKVLSLLRQKARYQ